MSDEPSEHQNVSDEHASDAPASDAPASTDPIPEQPPTPEAEPPPAAQTADAQAADVPISHFDQRITVRACPFAAPSLPGEAETALDATLLVKTAEGFGSAVLLSPDGFALTAAHVVGHDDALHVVGHGGHQLRATVVRVDEPQDVALLKVDVSSDSPCLRPVEQPARIGSDVFVLGSPAGEELSFSIAKGIVSGHRRLGGSRFVQLDAALNPGNSGGPAVSPAGEIVGIASWKVSDVSMEGLAFAVPIDVALVALGVELGAASSSDWASMKGRHARPASKPAPPRTATSAPIDPSLLRRRRIRHGLIVWGATSLGMGVTMIASTAAVYYTRDELTKAGWTALQVTNTIGWGLAAGGGAMLLGGLLVRKTPKQKRSTVSALPTGRGFLLHGRF